MIKFFEIVTPSIPNGRLFYKNVWQKITTAYQCRGEKDKYLHY